MNFGGTSFVIAIIAVMTVGWMFTTWVRAKHGYPIENEWGGTVDRSDPDADRKIKLLEGDNAKLAGQIGLAGRADCGARTYRDRDQRPGGATRRPDRPPALRGAR